MALDNSYLSVLPTEILLKIFTFLPAKDLIKCRQVSIRSKQLIDTLTNNDGLWRKHCRNDYPSVYRMARNKSRPSLLWYNIYKSLSLWSKLPQAREDLGEFALTSSIHEEVSNVRLLRDGVIGVHKKGSIVYYDIETLEKAKRGKIIGDYLRYAENRHTIAILNYQMQLFIIRKKDKNPNYETKVVFNNVKIFILVNENVYYVTCNDDIHVCRLKDFSSELINNCKGIMSLGYSFNKLHILTYHCNIYMVVGKEIVFISSLCSDSNLLHMLYKYNFLETLDWRIYDQWMYEINHTLPDGQLRDIYIVKIYGEVVFVGSSCGVLQIYHAPFSSGEFDLYKAKPLKEYDFKDSKERPVFSLCPIIQIEVSEIEDGHIVLAVMPKKIAVLKFTHNFKRSIMMTYQEIPKIP